MCLGKHKFKTKIRVAKILGSKFINHENVVLLFSQDFADSLNIL